VLQVYKVFKDQQVQQEIKATLVSLDIKVCRAFLEQMAHKAQQEQRVLRELLVSQDHRLETQVPPVLLVQRV
jgi:hypothetical protein